MKKIALALIVSAMMAQQADATDSGRFERTGRITSPSELFAARDGTQPLAIIPTGAVVFIADQDENWSHVRVRMGTRTLTGYVATAKVATYKINP